MDVILFVCYEISLWDFMLLGPCEILWDFQMRLHASLTLMRLPYGISPACITSSRYVCLRMTSRDLNMLLWFKEVLSGFGFVEWCMLFEECVPSLGCHSILIPGSSAFFSCTLIVNVIGLLFLRQCLLMLPPSTETWISGTSGVLPLCPEVSQYV